MMVIGHYLYLNEQHLIHCNMIAELVYYYRQYYNSVDMNMSLIHKGQDRSMLAQVSFRLCVQLYQNSQIKGFLYWYKPPTHQTLICILIALVLIFTK